MKMKENEDREKKAQIEKKKQRDSTRICKENEVKTEAWANSLKAHDTMWGDQIQRKRTKKISYIEMNDLIQS